jgi:hypothetical protein
MEVDFVICSLQSMLSFLDVIHMTSFVARAKLHVFGDGHIAPNPARRKAMP